MQPITVKIVSTAGDDLIPEYISDGAAGMDLRAASSGSIAPLEWCLVLTGLHMEIPEGYEGQVRPRSGLAARSGVTVLNAPGTIDSDYRGEVGVILANHSKKFFTFERGDRIAQIVFAPVTKAKIEIAGDLSELEDSIRDKGGFGSSGVK